MKTIALGILVAALACGSGCARAPDWIERTLVTVDVTGTWVGTEITGGKGGPASYELTLEQQGPKVKGSIFRDGAARGSTSGTFSAPIEGTVAGDVFSFRQINAPLTGETTVSGDEMTGEVSLRIPVYKITLRAHHKITVSGITVSSPGPVA